MKVREIRVKLAGDGHQMPVRNPLSKIPMVLDGTKVFTNQPCKVNARHPAIAKWLRNGTMIDIDARANAAKDAGKNANKSGGKE